MKRGGPPYDQSRPYSPASGNVEAGRIVLTEEDLAILDRAYPAPDRPTPLDMQ